MAEEEKKGIKKIKSAGLMRQIMGEYFMELKEAHEKGSPKIAWCTSVGPAELLRAFGFLVYSSVGRATSPRSWALPASGS